MRKLHLVILISLFANSIIAQTTLIPDTNFEQELINLGYDIGIPDGVIPTVNIDTITLLIISNKNISDLTGIQDFSSLTELVCNDNLINNLDISQNTNLVRLECNNNQLTNIDITQNLLLTTLWLDNNFLTNIDVSQNSYLDVFDCRGNQITNIDVTQNQLLTSFGCGLNQITYIDLSQNTILNWFACNTNQLEHLNLKNCNSLSVFYANNNPNLTCIEVDNVAYSSANWTNIDPTASYSTNCNYPCNISSYIHAYNGIGNYSFTNTSAGTFDQSNWAFGDGNISTLTNPNHTFSSNGTYVVVLTINDSATSCFDFHIDTITVTGVSNPSQCAAGFVMIPDTSTGDVTLVNSSTGNNLSYLWNFGDGNTSTLANPTHVYASSGPFYLCLTVDDGAGCNNMYCDSIGDNGVVFKTGGFTINVTGTPIITKIENIKKLNSTIGLYPNPTSIQLTIVSNQLNINEINVIDITGQTLNKIMTDFGVIDVSNLANGVYFIKVFTNEGTITKKFVKQ